MPTTGDRIWVMDISMTCAEYERAKRNISRVINDPRLERILNSLLEGNQPRRATLEQIRLLENSLLVYGEPGGLELCQNARPVLKERRVYRRIANCFYDDDEAGMAAVVALFRRMDAESLELGKPRVGSEKESTLKHQHLMKLRDHKLIHCTKAGEGLELKKLREGVSKTLRRHFREHGDGVHELLEWYEENLI